MPPFLSKIWAKHHKVSLLYLNQRAHYKLKTTLLRNRGGHCSASQASPNSTASSYLRLESLPHQRQIPSFDESCATCLLSVHQLPELHTSPPTLLVPEVNSPTLHRRTGRPLPQPSRSLFREQRHRVVRSSHPCSGSAQLLRSSFRGWKHPSANVSAQG